MVDSRKLQRNMSNALDKNYSSKRNTEFFFRVISAEVLFSFFRNSYIPSIMMIWRLNNPYSFCQNGEWDELSNIDCVPIKLASGRLFFRAIHICSQLKRSNLTRTRIPESRTPEQFPHADRVHHGRFDPQSVFFQEQDVSSRTIQVKQVRDHVRQLAIKKTNAIEFIFLFERESALFVFPFRRFKFSTMMIGSSCPDF